MMFAIRNIKTGKFLTGTDYRYHPPHQRTSNRKMLTYEDKWSAALDFNARGCGKDYRIVVLKRVEVKKVINFNTDDGYEFTLRDQMEVTE